MAGHWWSCVLGLLCIPAEATLSPMEVLQSPLYISQMRVNSTAEITCSTSRSDPMGFSLHRRFHSDRSIVYLSIDNGQVTRNNIAPEFTGRIHASRDQQIREGYGFTLRLSLLGLEDTDMYYCRWNYFNSEKEKREILSSNGTVIIIREGSSAMQQPQLGSHLGHLERDSINSRTVRLHRSTDREMQNI
ncbi:uncharacterized protein [Pempheris klunzingeri]|uniref:uncharacterized protein isoform X2 n=1 Tax=Pempheris klunzingeri TaxID=3127111 RepID=UPI0039801617